MKKLNFAFAFIFSSVIATAQWSTSGTNIYNSNTGNVGIGTNAPLTLLEVKKDQASPTVVAIRNLSASAGAVARYDLVTNAANSYQISALHNNNGAPYFQFGVGSAVTAAYFDAPEFSFRSTGAVSRLKITSNGNVGIGTTNPGTFKLAVEGKIGAREVRVTVQNPWPDYVFEKNYQLMPLEDFKQFVLLNKHLPGVPSAKEMIDKGGIDLGEMNIKLLEKVEELALYILELKKENDEIKKRLTASLSSEK